MPKVIDPKYYTLSPLQKNLLVNLVKLHATDADAENWLPYDINDVGRFPGNISRPQLAEALRSMELKGLVEGVRVPYCAFRQFRITDAGVAETARN
jgi:hypothetical protein